MSEHSRELQKMGGLPSASPGRPSVPRTKSEEMTDLIDSMALESGEKLSAMSLQAFKDALTSSDLKIRLSAAKAYFAQFHHPKHLIDVDVNETINISEAARDATDNLTAEERELVSKFEKFLPEMRPVDIEDAEVIDEDAGPDE